MRSLIAARKSNKVDGLEGRTLHTQDQAAQAFIERLGWTHAGTAQDTISGRTAPIDRKQLGHWLGKRLWDFDAVVAVESSRLSRGEDTDWSRIETWAADNGKVLVIVDGATGIRYPSRGDSDFWQWQAMKRETSREWHLIRERQLRAQADSVARGTVTGRAPYGYRIAGERYAKVFQVHPDEAECVREAFRDVAAGMSLRTVSQWLSVATGRPWDPSTVKDLIGNWTYAGRVERNGVHYADCPPIVSVTDLVEAQRAMSGRARKAPGGRPSIQPALLVPVCGECGKRMYRSGSAKALRYWCSGHHKFGVLCVQLDRRVQETLSASTEPERVSVTIKGRSYADEIATARRDRRQALERDEIAAVLEITDRLKELEARPVEPDRVERRKTGRTVGQVLAALEREDLRTALRSWRIIVWPDGRLRMESPWT